jgi:hypothetical protein
LFVKAYDCFHRLCFSNSKLASLIE